VRTAPRSRRSRHTRPRHAERARRCQSPSYASTGSACAHGRTLNSRCHRTAGALSHDGELVSPTSPIQRIGGARRDRTDDLKLAKLPLSQLSYGPDQFPISVEAVVGPDRFELSTPRLSSVCSNQLSYGPSPAGAAYVGNEGAATGLVLSKLNARIAKSESEGEEKRRRRRTALCLQGRSQEANVQVDLEDLLSQMSYAIDP
jgi:hypothetical protein